MGGENPYIVCSRPILIIGLACGVGEGGTPRYVEKKKLV